MGERFKVYSDIWLVLDLFRGLKLSLSVFVGFTLIFVEYTLGEYVCVCVGVHGQYIILCIYIYV